MDYYGELVQTIGEGTYGTIFSTDKKFCIKAMDYTPVNEDDPDEPLQYDYETIITEIAVPVSMNHPNIVKYHNIFMYEKMAMIVMDLYDGDLLNLENIHELPFNVQKDIIVQLVSGLKYMTDRGILHRDIKSQNVLYKKISDHKYNVVYTDFGLSLIKYDLQKEKTTSVYTLWYRSPELLLKSNKYGPKADVWALGCLLYEIFEPNILFKGDSVGQMLDIIYNKVGLCQKNTSFYKSFVQRVSSYKQDQLRRMEKSKSVNGHNRSNKPQRKPFKLELNKKNGPLTNKHMLFNELLIKMVHPDPYLRISIDDVTAHPFLKEDYNIYNKEHLNIPITSNRNICVRTSTHANELVHICNNNSMDHSSTTNSSTNYSTNSSIGSSTNSSTNSSTSSSTSPPTSSSIGSYNSTIHSTTSSTTNSLTNPLTNTSMCINTINNHLSNNIHITPAQKNNIKNTMLWFLKFKDHLNIPTRIMANGFDTFYRYISGWDVNNDEYRIACISSVFLHNQLENSNTSTFVDYCLGEFKYTPEKIVQYMNKLSYNINFDITSYTPCDKIHQISMNKKLDANNIMMSSRLLLLCAPLYHLYIEEQQQLIDDCVLFFEYLYDRKYFKDRSAIPLDRFKNIIQNINKHCSSVIGHVIDPTDWEDIENVILH